MTKHKVKDPKAIVCAVFGSFSFCAMIVLLAMGGVLFSKEHPKVLNYANSMCRVDSRSYKTYQCETRYSRYTCYGPTWNVYYGENRTIFAIVEVEKRYHSYSDALKKADEYQINSSYSCWYDTRHPSVAQWNKPNVLIGIILLSCGGLSVLLTGMFLFLAMQFIKQEKIRNRHDNMDPYSYSNPYTKQ